jgi:hypothetical protein
MTTIVVSTFIPLFLFFTKTLIIINFLITSLTFYEVYLFFSSDKSVKFLEKQHLQATPDYYPISKLLYTIHVNKVFDIIYARIKTGGFSLKHFITPKFIFILFFTSLTGISMFTIR